MKIAIWLCIICLMCGCAAARHNHTGIPWNCRLVNGTKFACKWKIIADSGRTEGAIIKFSAMQGRCGEEYVGAVAIIKRKTDTIRVIMPCYRYILEEGQAVNFKIVAPSDNISLPCSLPWGYKGNEPERVNEYDERVRATVFGYLK